MKKKGSRKVTWITSSARSLHLWGFGCLWSPSGIPHGLSLLGTGLSLIFLLFFSLFFCSIEATTYSVCISFIWEWISIFRYCSIWSLYFTKPGQFHPYCFWKKKMCLGKIVKIKYQRSLAIVFHGLFPLVLFSPWVLQMAFNMHIKFLSYKLLPGGS